MRSPKYVALYCRLYNPDEAPKEACVRLQFAPKGEGSLIKLFLQTVTVPARPSGLDAPLHGHRHGDLGSWGQGPEDVRRAGINWYRNLNKSVYGW